MSKEIYISSTPHETRLAIVEHDELTEIYYERENEYTLAGSIYNGKVTRVLPGMQSSFVDVGLERDAFLYITDFMEEAGDSAVFDTGESRGRSNGRRNDRGREGQQGENSPAESQDRPFTEAAEAGQDSQPEGRTSDRNDRNDRSRRRGRGGNREPRLVSDTPSFTDSTSTPPSPPLQVTPPELGNEADLGEGAPGADGSRRWRGRRGRRRGRGGNREGLPVGEAASGTADLDPSSLAPDPSSGYDLAEPSGSFESGSDSFDDFDLDASAAEPHDPSGSGSPQHLQQSGGEESLRGTSSEPSAAPPSLEPRESRTAGPRDASDRGRRDRGGRDRRDDRPRAPRGFAPSRALYGVDDTTDQGGADTAPIEPIILPGESLSKYRQGGEAAQIAASTPAAAAPAPEFTLPGAWDGGSILPGETIRPRSSSAGFSPEPRRDSRRDGRTDNRRTDRGTSGRQPAASFNVAPIASFRNEPAPVEQDADGPAIATPPEAEATLAEAAPALPLHESQTPPASMHQESTTLSAALVDQEYEPTEAKASHRFDPIPPREFRQTAPESESSPEASSLVHSITPPPGTPLTPLHTEGQPFESAASEPVEHSEHPAEVLPAHDLTSISEDGEMLSQTPPPPPAEEIAEPASPLQHETAILHAEPASHSVAEPESFATTPPADIPEISPEADNLIVEELSHETETESETGAEEEDFTTTLHAASIEEMDYDEEEETLEGAADLGTMLREMSIDEITQPVEPATEDEEDDYAFEEEDSVEDGAFANSFEETSEADSMGFTEADFSGEPSGIDDEVTDSPRAAGSSDTQPQEHRNEGRRGGRRDGRRGGRDRDRGGDRSRSFAGPIAGSSTSAGDRDRNSGSRPGRRDGHRSAQTTNLPAISDLLKPGQEVLVQIAKEPIAKKGARITSHIALPGRFLVFMPTVNHTGVSRKIESDGERRRLKEILLSEKGEASGGFIVRTAASGASEEELRSDLRFLLNLWADIKQRSEASKSPALIYHDLNLVERILRDQVTDNFSAIWVDTESEYERVLRFLQRFQPSLIRRVKLYTKETPLFEQFGITEEINKALRSKVWLKSGGSIVINQTEALVAIDINTGKYVGKTARLEDTIVKTNLDAIPEIVRQIRLRDLGGIIIIDFIDMDERKNRHKVMAVLEEELKKDRAPSKVLQFNDFGLVAITRKRVKQSLERTLSTTCGICAGTGMVKSAVSVCNDIYIEMRKMQKHLDRGDVMLRVNPEVVKQLKSPTAKWLQEMEEMVGKTILVKSDPTLHPEQFDIH